MVQPKNQNLTVERWDCRLTFAKEGRARYISHLDLMRTMQRAIKRSGIPIWYTQGFNPHAYLMFPLALPLGTDSSIEILDIAITEDIPFDTLLSRLNQSMPEGLYFVSAARPNMKHTDIAFAEYEITCSFDIPVQTALERLGVFMAQEVIEIEKRTKPKKGRKPGVKLVDIKPDIDLISSEIIGDKLFINLRLPAGSERNLGTSAVLDAFCVYAGAEIADIYTKRTKILTASGENFT